MKRLLRTLRCDLMLQWRNGFFYAAAFVVGLWALFGGLVGAELAARLGWLLPAMLLNEMVIVTFFFVGGLVLLEKNEGSLRAQLVSPLRTGEYLLSKLITLTAAAVLQCLLIVAAFRPALVNWALLSLGLALLAVIFTLAGLIVVLRARSLESYLVPAGLWVALLLAPLLPYVTGWNIPIIYLHPVQAPLVLLRAAFEPLPGWQLAYGVLGGAGWCAALYLQTRREWQRFVLAAL
jgi:fluoroquinolone transport system permease protein